MPTLNECASRVLSEFGGRIPAHLLQFEDARREFLQVRGLELQKLGIADTDKTVESKVLVGGAREGKLSAFGDMTPAFVEFTPTGGKPEKVDIVPVEAVPEYEGSYALAIYGNHYRAAFDFWNRGSITIWYDPVEDLFNLSGESEMTFASAFITYLVKKATFNLCGTLVLNLAFNSTPEEDERLKLLSGAIIAFQNTLAPQIAEWHREFKKYLNTDLNTQPKLRRTFEEIQQRGYGNTTRRSVVDLIG